MGLPSQKYQNYIRTVSGTPTIYPYDVVLMCTTTSAAVTINLDTFTSGYWSTQWKLYVVDASNNAGTNNITIVAPTGYKINGASSAIINTNGGSAIVEIVSNTDFIATMSSFSSTSLPLPFFYSQKLMQSASTTYLTQDGAGKFSVLSGQSIATYSSSVNVNLSGFSSSTGVWTVAATGYYAVSARMITRLLNTDINSTVDGGGLGWMTSGTGYMAIAVVKTVNGTLEVVASEKQAVVVDLVSDINIECTADVHYLAAGTTVKVVILNKTNHNVVGMASVPTCYIDFSAIKIG